MVLGIAIPVAITFTEAMSAVLYFVLVAAIAFAALCALASYLRFEALSQSGSLPNMQIGEREKLRLHIAKQLATGHRAQEPFSLLLAAQEAPFETLRERIAANLREDDDWIGACDSKVAAIVDADAEFVPLIVERIVDAVRRQGSGGDAALAMGAASFPEHAQGALELIERAESALATAESSAGYHMDEVAGERGTEETSPSGLSDPLTGLLRAEKLPLAIQKFVARFRRARHPVSVVYMDIDNLERYNAHYGEEAGDEILRQFGVLIQEHFRSTDLLGRYAAEEFVAVLPCTPDDAVQAAQRVAGAVKRHSFVCGQASLKITISAGVAGYPNHGKVPRRLLDCAFSALETAKERGQNLCLSYQPNMRATVHGAREADIF